MTIEQLTFAVGLQSAARLIALKSKMADTAAERMAEDIPASTVIDGLQAMLAARRASRTGGTLS